MDGRWGTEKVAYLHCEGAYGDVLALLCLGCEMVVLISISVLVSQILVVFMYVLDLSAL